MNLRSFCWHPNRPLLRLLVVATPVLFFGCANPKKSQPPCALSASAPTPSTQSAASAPPPAPPLTLAQSVRAHLAAGDQKAAEALLVDSPEVVFLNSVCLRSRFLVNEALPGWYRLVESVPSSPMGQVATCIVGQDIATNLPTQLYYFSGLMVVARNHPDDPLIHWMAAVMARDLTRDASAPLTEATRQRIIAYGIAEYRTALALFAPGPGPTLVHQTLANLLAAMGDNAGALHHYQIVLEQERRPWSLHAAATSFHDRCEWDEALRLADAALAQDPNHTGALYIRGDALWALDRCEEALAVWIADLPQKTAANCTYIGQQALAAGYTAQAWVFLDKAVKLAPKDPVAAVLLGRVAVLQGIPGANQRLLKLGSLDWRGQHSAIDADPDHPEWFNAVESGDVAAVRDLLATTPIDTRDKAFQATALMIASRCGWTEIVKTLLAAGAQRDLVDTHRDTALHWATQFKQHDCVQLLLAAGANPNLFDQWGQSPLVMSVSEYQWKTARLLINHPSIDLNGCAANRGTALHAAAGYGQTDIVRTLLDHHADANRANPQNGTTPLMMTCSQYHHPDALLVLLDAGAEVNAQDHQGRTALRRAIQPAPTPQLTDALLSHGADPLIADQNGVTPLAAAHLLGYGELAARMEALLRTPTPALPWSLPMLTRPADATTAEALRNAFTLPIALIYGLPLEPVRNLTPDKANKQARDTLNTQFAITDVDSFKATLLATDRLNTLNHPGKLATRLDAKFPQYAAGLDNRVASIFYAEMSAKASPLAWRKSHLIYLARLGATAGYLPTDEAEEICANASETLRGTFTTWTEFADSFNFGAVQYAGWERSRYEHLCRLLLSCPPETSPWDNSIWRPTPTTPPPSTRG